MIYIRVMTYYTNLNLIIMQSNISVNISVINLKAKVLSGVHTAHDIGRHRPVSLCRPMSSDIVRQGIQRCRMMSCAVWTSLYAMVTTSH